MRSGKKSGGCSGFTLVELLVSVGIIVVISAVALTSLFQRRNRSEFENTIQQVTSLLREAHSKSVAQTSSTIWGVHFENATTTMPFFALFPTAYSPTGHTGYYRLPVLVRYATSSLAEGASLDVTFAQITGAPSTSTSVMFEFVSGNVVIATSSVTVGASGLITE